MKGLCKSSYEDFAEEKQYACNLGGGLFSPNGGPGTNKCIDSEYTSSHNRSDCGFGGQSQTIRTIGKCSNPFTITTPSRFWVHHDAWVYLDVHDTHLIGIG